MKTITIGSTKATKRMYITFYKPAPGSVAIILDDTLDNARTTARWLHNNNRYIYCRCLLRYDGDLSYRQIDQICTERIYRSGSRAIRDIANMMHNELTRCYFN